MKNLYVLFFSLSTGSIVAADHQEKALIVQDGVLGKISKAADMIRQFDGQKWNKWYTPYLVAGGIAGGIAAGYQTPIAYGCAGYIGTIFAAYAYGQGETEFYLDTKLGKLQTMNRETKSKVLEIAHTVSQVQNWLSQPLVLPAKESEYKDEINLKYYYPPENLEPLPAQYYYTEEALALERRLVDSYDLSGWIKKLPQESQVQALPESNNSQESFYSVQQQVLLLENNTKAQKQEVDARFWQYQLMKRKKGSGDLYYHATRCDHIVNLPNEITVNHVAQLLIALDDSRFKIAKAQESSFSIHKQRQSILDERRNQLLHRLFPILHLVPPR